MSTESRTAELRRAFDASFARPLVEPGEAEEDLLAVRIAGTLHAIRLADIGGVVAHRRITAVPSDAPGLLGLAGIRGEVVPVYRLAFFLGDGDARAPTGWWVLEPRAQPLALAFDALDAHLRIPRSAIRRHERLDRAHPLSSEVAITERGPLPVIAIPLVFAAIRARTREGEPQRSEDP